jgi:lipopolysaccharide export system permease protein
MVPALLVLTLPFSLLIATALACMRLANDRETVALSAAGVSPLRLLKPFVLAACALGLMVGGTLGHSGF